MRRSSRVFGRRHLGALALVVATACSGETGLMVEVNWEAGSIPPGADQLRIYVGTAVAGLPQFVVSDGGTTRAFGEVESPYRYLLRPEGDLAAIGELQIAAAITRGQPPERIEPLAFAAYPTTVKFVDGQVGLVRLTLGTDSYLPAGPAGECALYRDPDDGSWSIGRADDADCDGTLDAADCAPFDPADASTATDGDGDGVACGDCLDAPAPVRLGGPDGWMINPGTVFPGQNEAAFRAGNPDLPDTVDCLHIDFDCSGVCGDEARSDGGPTQPADPDGSGSSRCGAVALRPDRVTCAPRPSDCDEQAPGHTRAAGDPEICDGTDSNCDGRPAPALPCAIDRGGPLGCNIGVHACNDDVGRYAGDPAACEDIMFPHLFSLECATLRALDGGASSRCAYDPDPLKCAGADGSECRVGVDSNTGACGEVEKVTLPGLVGMGCDWRIVGGMMQGDWDVGLIPQNDTSVGMMPATQACAPFLVVRPANADPQPRTIMLLGDARTAVTPVRAWFLTLKADNVCDGMIDCEPLLVPAGLTQP
ncbi:MAG: putative metal-binding motif-containing protein [Myxococcales bacterium]|nr:putative metal-binding motif-containing protein [Myxococcales bacterium]